MTATETFILTTAISLLIVVLVVVAEVVRKRRLQTRTLQQRVQQLERRELAAANAAQDISAKLSLLETRLAHSQRLLMNGLIRSGRLPGAANTLSASRDERKLRELLPQA